MNWKWNVSTLFRELKFSLLNGFMQWLIFNITFSQTFQLINILNVILCVLVWSLQVLINYFGASIRIYNKIFGLYVTNMQKIRKIFCCLGLPFPRTSSAFCCFLLLFEAHLPFRCLSQLRVCVCMLSCVHLFVILWTVALQAPLSMGFSRQGYSSGLPFPSSGDLSYPGIKPGSPSLAGGFFTTESPRKP